MNNLNANYNKILQTIRPFAKNIYFPRQNRKPKLKNIELIALNLTAEYMSIDSESQLFRMLTKKLSGKITRSVYNRRRRGLFQQIEALRQKLATAFNEFQEAYIVDSMPVPVAKPARAKGSTICQENEETAPDMGYCASQKVNYYGYKLHATCSIQGVISHFDLTKASVHDVNYLKDVKHNFKNCTIIGDKGYVGADYQADLLQTSGIRLEVPMRKNQKNYRKYAPIFRKQRKRIETVFSQLGEQFNLKRNYAKSFTGLATRLLSKITAFTIIQYLNKFHFKRDLNKVKINIT